MIKVYAPSSSSVLFVILIDSHSHKVVNLKYCGESRLKSMVYNGLRRKNSSAYSFGRFGRNRVQTNKVANLGVRVTVLVCLFVLTFFHGHWIDKKEIPLAFSMLELAFNLKVMSKQSKELAPLKLFVQNNASL